VAVPVEALAMLPPWPAKACGSELIRSSVRVVPVSRTSWLLTTVTGLVAVSCG
jgi:hypothetical protein